jgi:hypothetical protein
MPEPQERPNLKGAVAIVFAWLQRYLVRGLALGAVK